MLYYCSWSCMRQDEERIEKIQKRYKKDKREGLASPSQLLFHH